MSTSRVGPDDPRYATLVRGFNLRWAGTPAYVQVCSTTADVVAAVQEAVDSHKRITVQSGGHCYENFAVGNHGGVIIDMAGLNRVHYDEALRAYSIEAGCTNWNIYWNLYKEFGLTIPAGSCYSVGAGGHLTGGGYGLLSRKFGLTVDWIWGVEIVVVDKAGKASAVVVTADSPGSDERALLWANQGGGGGNFGIVTRFLCRELPHAPAEAHIANLAWNWSDMTEPQFATLVGRYGSFLRDNSAPGSPYDGLFALLHLTVQAAKQLTLTVQYAGDRPELLREFIHYINGDAKAGAIVAQVHPVGRNFLPLSTTDVTHLPWLYATQTLDGSGANQRGKYKSAYMKEPFPESQIRTMWKWLYTKNFNNAQALLQVDSYGCAVNAVASDATAVAQRSSIMKLQYQTYWWPEKDTQQNLDWIRGFYDEMYGPDGPQPDATMDGCYVNYPDCDLKDWAHLYYLGNYARLQQVKQRWDPNDVFNHAQSIRLP